MQKIQYEIINTLLETYNFFPMCIILALANIIDVNPDLSILYAGNLYFSG